MQELYGDTLPWPLNYFIPYSQSVAARQRFKGRDARHIYDAAVATLESLNLRCAASGGPYLLGKRPCSLDAKAYGLLAFIRAAGTAAPVLKDALEHSPSLLGYLGGVTEAHFGAPAPPFDLGAAAGGWSAAGSGEAASTSAAEDSAAARLQRRRSLWWLGGVAAVIVGYVLLGVEVEFEEEGEEGEEGKGAG